MDLGAVADAIFMAKFVEDVNCELADVRKYYIKKQDADFGIASIVGDQKEKKMKYKEKMMGDKE